MFHVDLWEKRVAILLEGTHFFPDKPVDQNYEKIRKYIRQTNKQKQTIVTNKQKYQKEKSTNKQTLGGEGAFLTLERLDKSYERTKFWRDEQTSKNKMKGR